MLHIHRAERADVLADALGELLAEPPEDPFAPEVVSVPTRGMERWLAQRLSGRLGAAGGRGGVCANVAFPPPRRLVGDVVAAATGIDPDRDPWRPERALWPLLEVVEASLHEDWLAILAAHLEPPEGEPRRARRFSTVRHLAGLFDRYALDRPELVRAWAAGESPGSPWQAELWRRLRDRIGAPSPAERLAEAVARLREDPDVAGLPGRVALFGLTRLPAGQLEVLGALAARRDVHLLLLHPSPELWARAAAALDGCGPRVRRREDPTAALPANRLLASWGRDAREMQVVLAGAGEHRDHHHPLQAPEPATLLERIQADIRLDRRPPGPPLRGQPERRPLLDPDDRSIQVHACHGRARQVEVIRDAILHELASDPTLEPRDIVVMCPDIETFAPLIHATFGAGGIPVEDESDARTAVDEGGPAPGDGRPPDLRVRLADRSLRQTNPVLGVVAQLVDLAERRLTAPEVLDLADREPVRRRFGLDDDDLARIEAWVADSGIRWGLDGPHRRPYRLDSIPAGTWRAGLDRVLLGVTMTEDGCRLFEGVLPLDDVESGAIDLAGRLAELVDRLGAAIAALRDPKPVAAWAEAIAAAADELCATGPREAWQRAELQRILDEVVAEATAGEAPSATALTLPEVRVLLADRLQGRPTRANFRTGHLTMCTLVPMRSVPHRVVCLLGLDDAVFPRNAARDGDDLMLLDERVGDRDPRSEDRQQLLDALLAARDRLIIAYTGNDERTNQVRPPAVPVGELLDVVDRTVRTADGRPAREQVVTRHPLQPFDPRNFRPGALRPGGPWSFDPVVLEGARALEGPRLAPAPFLDAPLAPSRSPVVELEALVRFVEHPVRAFLRQRLGLGGTPQADELADALPIDLDGLERWAVGERLLQARLEGIDPDTAVAAEIARGCLPPGALAQPVIEDVWPVVEQLAARAHEALGGPPRPGSLDVRVALPDGRVLSGTVPGVSGTTLLHVTYSRLRPRHRLGAWVRWLALTAAHPERAFDAATIGRAREGARQASVSVARLAAPADDAAGRRAFALAELGTLLDLYDRGMREPLPIAPRTSAAYAHAAHRGVPPEGLAARVWESGFNRPGEDGEPEHRLVLGGVVPFAELLAAPPRDEERGDGWDEDDPSRFGRYARRLWAGLLAIEQVRDL
jgi:exodeoxyribonuclease V gamma subunit